MLRRLFVNTCVSFMVMLGATAVTFGALVIDPWMFTSDLIQIWLISFCGLSIWWRPS